MLSGGTEHRTLPCCQRGNENIKYLISPSENRTHNRCVYSRMHMTLRHDISIKCNCLESETKYLDTKFFLSCYM